jgi:hypothetical protein
MVAPDKAIPLIQRMYGGRYQGWSSGNAQVDSLAGGPHEGVTWPLYNAVGNAYPNMTREQRDAALKQLIGIWDGINYGYVNGARGVGHTTGIHEPLLVADIGIVRRIYWPGLEESHWILKGHDTFKSFADAYLDENGMFKPGTVDSNFVIAYAVLRTDKTNYGEEYAAHANPEFLNRVIKGIVAVRFGGESSDEGESADIERGMKRLRELLPKSLHERIEPLRQEADWADYRKFP